MRTLLLITIFSMSTIWSYAQNKYPYSGTDVTTQYREKAKKDTGKKYNYFVVIPVSDYQQLANALNEYKRLAIYDPIPADAQKVAIFKSIELYLKELPGRVKLDSILKK